MEFISRGLLLWLGCFAEHVGAQYRARNAGELFNGQDALDRDAAPLRYGAFTKPERLAQCHYAANLFRDLFD